MDTTGFDLCSAQKLLKEGFAPWVQELDIQFDKVADGEAILRVPPSARLNRIGGTICGQAIMALADTAMVFAVSSAVNAYVPMTTVSQSSSFLRPAADADLIAHASIIKRGRNIVYGEVNLYTERPDKPIAHITSTYMLL
ncbi:MAG: PaaI family thioesterase [Pseudomonadales bacterium]|nr:PaaI family thioesterase [Pseudomonadales bacterium]